MVSLAIYNLKGGVGKTAAAVNLALLSARDGYRTIVWDLDPQGSSSFYLNVAASVKNESKKLFLNELDLADAVQPSPYENLAAIPADLSARQADLLFGEAKQSKKKIASLISSLKKNCDVLILDCPPRHLTAPR